MLDEARHEIEAQARACPDLELLAEFLKHSTRGIIR
jgi:acyl-[acyl carrier protein]--UDP-N-acetylglucosamine O-acyltransferase